MPGNVVIINGTSSAGKSSTAQALQRIMDEPYIHTGSEHFLPRVPQQCFTIGREDDPSSVEYFLMLYKGEAPKAAAPLEGGTTVFGLGDFAGVRIGPKGVALLSGIYRGIAALAASGVNVVVDDVIHDRRVLEAIIAAFSDLPVLFVGLFLPREEAERREVARGNRGPGGAAAFYDLVHAHAIYDLELDSSQLTPEECALCIKEALESGLPRSGFNREHPSLTVNDDPDERDLRFIEEQIYRYNTERTGIDDGRPVAFIRRDAQGIVAGLSGFTWGGVLEVKALWVREDMRGHGYGTDLLAAAEREAIKRGCTQAILDTHSFQAPDFYRQRGYDLHGIVTDYPPGHSKVYLRKDLRTTAP